jgi:hypothetical protein
MSKENGFFRRVVEAFSKSSQPSPELSVSNGEDDVLALDGGKPESERSNGNISQILLDHTEHPYRTIDPETERLLEEQQVEDERRLKEQQVEDERRLKKEQNKYSLSERVGFGERRGESVELNLPEILESSRKFFLAKGLPDFAAALPGIIHLSEESLALIVKAMIGELGSIVFDRAMIIPSADFQEPVNSDSTINEQRRIEILKDLKNKLDPDKSFFLEFGIVACSHSEAFKHPLAEPIREKRKKAYIVFYPTDTDRIPCKGMAPSQAQARFNKNGWDGLTLVEGLIIAAKIQGDDNNHDFEADKAQPKKDLWFWLLGTRDGSGGCASVYWNPHARLFEVYWGGENFSTLGSLPAVVVPIECDICI